MQNGARCASAALPSTRTSLRLRGVRPSPTHTQSAPTVNTPNSADLAQQRAARPGCTHPSSGAQHDRCART
eukprot:435914-Pyramimonas_sp.AAC.1